MRAGWDTVGYQAGTTGCASSAACSNGYCTDVLINGAPTTACVPKRSRYSAPAFVQLMIVECALLRGVAAAFVQDGGGDRIAICVGGWLWALIDGVHGNAIHRDTHVAEQRHARGVGGDAGIAGEGESVALRLEPVRCQRDVLVGGNAVALHRDRAGAAADRQRRRGIAGTGAGGARDVEEVTAGASAGGWRYGGAG